MSLQGGRCRADGCLCRTGSFKGVPTTATTATVVYILSPCGACQHSFEAHSAIVTATDAVTPSPVPFPGAPTAQTSLAAPDEYGEQPPQSTSVKFTLSSHSWSSQPSSSAADVRSSLRTELNGRVFVDVADIRNIYLHGSVCQSASHHATPEAAAATARTVLQPPAYSHAVCVQWIVDTLNTLASQAHQQQQQEQEQTRRWVNTKEQQFASTFNARRPDFVLAAINTTTSTAMSSCSTTAHINWSSILVLGVHQSAGSSESTCILQLADYASEIFTHQPLRLYVHTILTYKRPPGGLRIIIYDRAGAIGSTKLPLDSTTLLELATAYAQVSHHLLGFDTVGVQVQPDGIYTIPLPDGEIAVVGPTICRRPGVVCRGTYCAIATPITAAEDATDTKASGPMLVKFSWRSQFRQSEGELLLLAASRHVIGLAKHVSHHDLLDIHSGLRRGLVMNPQGYLSLKPSCVRLDFPLSPSRSNSLPAVAPALVTRHLPTSTPTSTSTPLSSSRRANEKYNTASNTLTLTRKDSPVDYPSSNRIYTRLILSTVGTPITSLTKPLHILQCLLGALIGHASLYFQGKILHRDVSGSNVMYIPKPLTLTSEEVAIHHLYFPSPPADHAKLYGFMIDLDSALDLSLVPTAPSATHRTGTLPFISIGVLEGDSHMYRHDLESFLYVLLWVCIHHPTTAMPTDDNQSPFPLADWLRSPPNFPASIKFHQMISEQKFTQLLDHITRPEYGPLKDLAREWRDVLFAVDHYHVDQPTLYSYPDLQAGYIKPEVTEWEGFTRFRDAVSRSIQAVLSMG